MQLARITTHPIKSFQGIDLQDSALDDRGLCWDREWMLVDEQGEMITQRSHPQLSQLGVQREGQSILLRVGSDVHELSMNYSGPSMEVRVWDDVCVGIRNNEEIDAALSTFMGFAVHLVRMQDSWKRPVVIPEGVQTRADATASFSDGYPLLIISEASLDDLNQRLAEPVPMNRFRPNLVINGADAFAEDNWRQIKIGETVIDLVKPCARCVFTCVDQKTGERGKEPLKTLATYRKFDKQILFGMNAIHRSNELLRVGDTVEVLA